MMELSAFEKKMEMTRVSNAMAAHTKPALSAIYGVISKNEGELIGSGTFLRIRGQTYLLTAKHVIDLSKNYSFLAHTTSFGGHPAAFTNSFRCLPKPIDLAITRIDEKAFENTGIAAFNVEIIAADSAGLERQFLFCHGYPGHKSKPLSIDGGGVHSESMPFQTSDHTTTWEQFDPAIHVVVSYPNFGWFDKNGPIPRPDAYCMSGSALWQTHRSSMTTNTWTPDKAQIAGVLILWDMHSGSLVATRAEVVRNFLLDAIRQEAAYFRWLDRGQPPADDWADWYHAGREIGLLTSF
jgi:hypothetical protein